MVIFWLQLRLSGTCDTAGETLFLFSMGFKTDRSFDALERRMDL